MHSKLITILLLVLISSGSQAQWFSKIERKHELFGGWGWNRSSFTTSDISFKGDGYDFTLHDVKAKDRQTHFKAETYFGLRTMTIPQTNFRFGYFITNNIAVTGGVDHMKYVMIQDQQVSFTGYISDTTYSQMVQDDKLFLTNRFLTFEHTDGLNYINTEIEYYQNIFSARRFQLNAVGGAGAGVLMPKSNVKLMGFARNDEFHLAGYAASARIGFELLFWRRFFIKFEYKTGFVNMPDIVTRKSGYSDRASQHFFFAERDGMFGFNIPLKKKLLKVSPAE